MPDFFCLHCNATIEDAATLCAECRKDDLELIGKELAGFPIREVVARHVHQVWYRADSPDRPVLVKVLPTSPEVGFPEVKGMLDEIRFLRSHGHPALPEIYHTGGDRRLSFGVYEQVEGIPLLSRLMDAPLSVQEALPLVLAIADLFAHINAKGMVVRVISPRQLIMPPGGGVRLMGIANICSEKGTVLPPGPGYDDEEGFRAHEILTHPRQAHFKIDVYLLGSLLYLCLVGVFLFRTTQRKHSYSGVLDYIPSEIGEIISRSLSPDLARRYSSVKEMAAALRATGLAAGGPGTEKPSTELRRAASGRKKS